MQYGPLMPAYIPYDKVNMAEWRSSASWNPTTPTQDVDGRFTELGAQFEHGFDGVIQAPGHKLHPAARGRAKQKSLEIRSQQCPLLKPSRLGEVAPSSDMLGRSVQKWFQQLQSIKHAVQAHQL
jgi:hypothetical protein